MTGAGAARGRRWFMRSATGAALAVVAMGAQAVLGPAVASAQGSCCALLATMTTWCHWLCAEQNHRVQCWSCNNNQCKCCECSVGGSCFQGITFCSYQIGCC